MNILCKITMKKKLKNETIQEGKIVVIGLGEHE